jgi:O-antigen/teichoic acid export membrane protein
MERAHDPSKTESPNRATDDELVRWHVRGSTLLLAGRFIQLASNLAIQLIIVRYLSKEGYGAFAYALAVVVLGETAALFGLDRAVGRLIPIHLEKRDYARAFGVIAISVATVSSIGAAFVALVLLARGEIESSVVNDHRTVTLLVLIIALAPIQALEDLIRGLFSVLARPRTLFFRAYVLEPALRLAVVLLMILTHSDVYFLAVGYVLAGAIGLVISTYLLVGILRADGLLEHLSLRTIQIPFRSTFSFTLPLLSTDLVNVLLFSVDTVLLGYFEGPSEVASFRVIYPVASLIIVPFTVFTLLYIPLASRMFARRDLHAIENLYRNTTIWIVVVSFPLFALTFAAATPVTTLLFGSRYEDSALFLSILAVGYYTQGAFGFNGMTLTVFGRVRDLTSLNVFAMIFNLGINLVLIPRYGALGAAIGTSCSLIVHSALKQVALRLGTGVRLLDVDSARPLAVVGVASLALALAAPLLAGHDYAGIPIAVVTSVVVLVANRRSLDIGGMFPEILRLPGLRRFARA